jgi:hypothetical protein
VVESGKVNIGGYARVRGVVYQNQLGALTLQWRNTGAGAIVFSDVIPQTGGQPNFTYQFDTQVRAPYLTIRFQNGPALSATFIAHAEAFPNA